jgi:hypothetical protein
MILKDDDYHECSTTTILVIRILEVTILKIGKTIAKDSKREGKNHICIASSTNIGIGFSNVKLYKHG